MDEERLLKIITGGKYSDKRGMLNYFNDFNLNPVKRMYILEHPDSKIVRAWQGHQDENKWFHVVSVAFKIVLVKPDNCASPSANLAYQEYNLSVENSQVLHVPGGYATGIKAMETNSKMLVFSNFSIAESLNDDFRYEKDKWYNWY
jgi:dTDP-4-dehydrorhamnose 3,5-epimerase-like enzyme